MTHLHLKQWIEARENLIIAKHIGLDIITVFRENHNNVPDFEQQYNVNLPEDIAAMLGQ